MENHVLSYLDEIVKKKPDKLAYANEEVGYTFRQAYQQSRAVGTWIHQGGYCREPVAVLMERHPRTILCFLGIVAAGCFYAPIDLEMPQSRIQMILASCKARLLICDESVRERAESLSFPGEVCTYEEIAVTPEDGEALGRIREASLDVDPIYVVFTSGSTGTPKGVAACHRSVMDYIEQLSEALGFDENTVFGNQAPLHLDACLKELYPTLKFGATTYLIPKSLFLFPVKLMEFLNKHQINTICWVASALSMVSALGTFDTVRPEHLKTVAFGSEAFPVRQLRRWREALPEAAFTNLYGPTEGTGMCCYYHVDREFSEDERIPIGRPFPNTEILLLDENDRRAKEGEICIRGTSVTLGYYNDRERTAESYVQNPLNVAYPEIIYRTGDIGRYNERGELVFVSRRDHQIKHMGHRIELGEIEAAISRVDGVALCGCVHDAEKGRILAYYVGEPDPGELMDQLKQHLPRYMLPNRAVRLVEIPRTVNGKIDRRALQEMGREGRGGRGGRDGTD